MRCFTFMLVMLLPVLLYGQESKRLYPNVFVASAEEAMAMGLYKREYNATKTPQNIVVKNAFVMEASAATDSGEITMEVFVLELDDIKCKLNPKDYWSKWNIDYTSGFDEDGHIMFEPHEHDNTIIYIFSNKALPIEKKIALKINSKPSGKVLEEFALIAK